MKINLKEKKGITLIALIVTIVVLIILAGVSINLVLGENGIVTKAKQAKRDIEQAKLEEEKALNQLDNYTENLGEIVIKGPIAGGNYDNPYIPTGFTHIEGNGAWNSGYIIKETATGNEFVWVPCVTDQSKVKEGDTVVTFGKTLPSSTATTDPYYKYNQNNRLGVLPTDTSVASEDSSVAEIETSVSTYGGFYIAKYEAGISGTTDNSSLEIKTATDGTVKPLSQAGCGVWNYITRTNAITVSKAMINTASTGAKSTLISGAAWDTTLQWMVTASTNASSNAGYDTNSIGKGWYSDEANGTIHLTGYYAVNNIYDMAGNVWEWTTENCTYNGVKELVIRGGHCNGSGSDLPAAIRSPYTDTEYIYFAFRVVLYK